MKIKELNVNVDHVATVREARGGFEPDPVHAALIAEQAGADGIVCHLREDMRHINDRDVRLLREMIKTRLDFEMAATDELIAFALEIIPEMVTIVPERRMEVTTEGGLNVAENVHFNTQLVDAMHKRDIIVSFFIDPTPRQIEASAKAGADMVEFHTGHYANATSGLEKRTELQKVRESAGIAESLGLRVAVGHGLNYNNILPICSIPQIVEISIGHAIVSRAIFSGFATAVSDMVALIKYGSSLTATDGK